MQHPVLTTFIKDVNVKIHGQGLKEANSLLIKEKDIRLLIDLGFTRNQAKLYLTLLILKESDGRTLHEKTNIARPEIYRTLSELERKGLVEKEISSTPYRYIATPVDFGLQILIAQQVQQCKETQERTKEFLRNFKNYEKDTLPEHEYKIIEVKGRQRLIQLIKLQHDNAQREIKIISSFRRWMQILDCCFENYEKAMARGVEYKAVIDATESNIRSQENIHALLTKPNFKLKLSRGPLKTNAAVFDQKEVTVNFFPSELLAESPMIWTNHPSFISMCQDHFEVIWESAREYKLLDRNI